MSFKSQVEADIDKVFLNTDVFAEEHIINNAKCVCVVQDVSNSEDLTIDKGSNYYPVIYGEAKTINIAKSNLPHVPKYNERILLDNAIYTVVSVADDMGMLTIMVVGDSR